MFKELITNMPFIIALAIIIVLSIFTIIILTTHKTTLEEAVGLIEELKNVNIKLLKLNENVMGELTEAKEVIKALLIDKMRSESCENKCPKPKKKVSPKKKSKPAKK
jgi:hypothetical protein